MNTAHDEQLHKVRGRLLARGSELNDRIHRVHADLSRQREPLPGDAPDAAVLVENDEVLRAIEQSAASEMHRIDHALERIEAGAFGVCETCGEDIGLSRLEVVPYATRCADCERQS